MDQSLTPQQIQTFNQVTGWNTPITPIPSQNQSRSDEILNIGKQAMDAKSSTSPIQNTGSFYGGGPSSIGQKLITDVNEGAADYSSPMGTKQLLGPTKSLYRGLGDIAGAVFHPIGSAIDAVTGGKLSQFFNKIAQSSPTEGSIMDKVTNSPAIQKFVMDHPELGEDFQRGLNLLFLGQADISSPDASTLGNRTANQVNNTVDTVKNTTGKIVDTATSPMSSLKNFLSEKNVNPQVETAAARLDDPLDQYNQYAQQAQANKFDATEDKPLEQVGQDAGDAFKQVVKMRQTVGKMMANELKQSGLGETETDISDAHDNFNNNLEENNLKYDPKTQSISPTGQTKMTSADQDILEQYNIELQKLGSNPSIKDLDAFVSRVPKEMDLYKSQNNIIGMTNAERIVNNSLNGLRGQFDPETTENQGLQDYSDFRKAYSDLSDKINEASKYFGKMNPDGTFSRDTSMVKSSITSLLGGGKRAVLQDLQELTGEPILDKAVLAAQAMQDSGDASGTSLLQTLYDNPPSDVSSLTGKLAQWGIGKAKGLFLGSPAEQTRTFLGSLKGNDYGNTDIQTNNSPNTMSANSANPGDSASNMKNTNSSINGNVSQGSDNVKLSPEDDSFLKEAIEYVKNYIDHPKMGNSIEDVSQNETGGTGNDIFNVDNVTKNMGMESKAPEPIADYVKGTVQTMKNVLTDPDMQATGGVKDVPGMITRVQDNIVKGLPEQYPNNPTALHVTKVIRALSPTEFPSLDAFSTAVNGIIDSLLKK